MHYKMQLNACNPRSNRRWRRRHAPATSCGFVYNDAVVQRSANVLMSFHRRLQFDSHRDSSSSGRITGSRDAAYGCRQHLVHVWNVTRFDEAPMSVRAYNSCAGMAENLEKKFPGVCIASTAASRLPPIFGNRYSPPADDGLSATFLHMRHGIGIEEILVGLWLSRS